MDELQCTNLLDQGKSLSVAGHTSDDILSECTFGDYLSKRSQFVGRHRELSL